MEMQEHVFANYMRFIEIFKEFKEVQSVNIECYDPCFETIKASLKDLMTSVSIKSVAHANTIDKGSAEWWQELPDELDMLLADEKYEECIGVIEEARLLQVKPEAAKFKLDFDVHVLKVIECIAKELQKPQVGMPEIYIEYLKRLNALPAAEDAYFLGKSQQLKLYMRRITITEAPAEGIPKQCQTFAGLLRGTATESMKLQLSLPKLINWIQCEVKNVAWEVGETLHMVEKIEDLASVFHLILRSFDALEQLGLSVSITFQFAFLPFMQKRIQEIYVKEEAKVEQDIAGEVWKAQVIQIEGSSTVLRLSSSCISLYSQILRILNECCLFLDDHLKSFSSLVPLFLKTMKAIIEKYIESDKFDDKRDNKIVQVITCNLWNLASLVSVLCKNIVQKLKIPQMEIPELSIIEIDANLRGDEILSAFALGKWNDELQSYLTSLYGVEKLQSPDEIQNILNYKHCVFIKEGVESVASSTDRNLQKMEKFCKVVVEAYLQVLEHLLNQPGGHFELGEFTLPAFQQLYTDLAVMDLMCKGFNADAGIAAFLRKVLSAFIKRKNTEEMLIKFRDEVYQRILLKVMN